MFLSVIEIPFWMLLSGLAIEGIGVDPFMQNTTNVQRVTITRGEFSLISDHDCIDVHFGLFCHVTTLDLNVATSQRRDVDFTLLCNVATLDIHVATLD